MNSRLLSFNCHSIQTQFHCFIANRRNDCCSWGSNSQPANCKLDVFHLEYYMITRLERLHEHKKPNLLYVIGNIMDERVQSRTFRLTLNGKSAPKC